MLLPVAALIFLTAVCVFAALYLAIMERHDSPRAELKRRLQRMARSGANEMSEELRAEITRETKPADLFFSRLAPTRNLDKQLDHAGLKITVSRFVMNCAAIALAFSTVVVFFSKSYVMGLAAAGLTVVAADIFLKAKTSQRREKFTELFPDALTMISRSLVAGHSFTTAIQLVGQEVPSPVGELFKAAYDQQQLGLRVVDGLNNMNNMIDSIDLRFFTTVVNINSETGGNLAEVLEKLAVTIRERLRIRRQVMVYTAQGRMSGYVLGALPVIAFFMFNMLNPTYESLLYKEPLGRKVLLLAVSMQLLGLLVIKKIIRIKI